MMLYPLLNMTIKGGLWYQGESNVFNPKNYSCLFPNFIEDLRLNWAPDARRTADVFPFVFIQLAGYCKCGSYNCDNSKPIATVADVRWAQTAGNGYVPNIDMVPEAIFIARLATFPPDISFCIAARLHGRCV